MKKLSNKGFTLVELIIVIAILAIIMLIAIPNVPQIIQRNRVKTDRQSAQKLCELVRAWHSDYSTDPLLSDTMTDIPKVGDTGFKPINYKDIEGLDTYVEDDFKPSSLLDDNEVAVEDQYFGVFFNGNVLGVAVLGDGHDGSSIASPVSIDYDGYTDDTKHPKSGYVAYIEIEEAETETDPDGT